MLPSSENHNKGFLWGLCGFCGFRRFFGGRGGNWGFRGVSLGSCDDFVCALTTFFAHGYQCEINLAPTYKTVFNGSLDICPKNWKKNHLIVPRSGQKKYAIKDTRKFKITLQQIFQSQDWYLPSYIVEWALGFWKQGYII